MLKLISRRFLLVAVLVGALAACGPAPLGTGWPAVSLLQSQCGDQPRDGILVAFNDRIVVINPANGKALELLNADCELRPPDADGTAKVWDFKPGSARQFYSSPVLLDNQTLLAVSYDQRFFEIEFPAARADSTEGIPIEGRTGHTVADLLVAGDTIYVGLSAKDLLALDRETFDVLWTAPTEHGVWAKPLLVEDTLYFASLDHYLYAVNAETGEQLWRLDLEGAITATPVFHNGHLFIGSFGRKVFEVSLEGQIVNQYTTDEWVWGTVTIVDDTLYVADLGGNVYALNTANDLAQIWKQKVAASAIRPAPVVSGDVVIVAARDHKLYWLNRNDGTPFKDADGNPLVRELSNPILSDVLLIEPGPGVDIPEPYIIVSTLSPGQLLAAYTLDNGQAVWSYSQ
ncbi:MAG: PQQ-binding-like beta-propeller repeat protein [Anaerolineae bacterium]|nr:PQQ-binding-like beta-propeller repeat protein [Anaerolineae bacterium]